MIDLLIEGLESAFLPCSLVLLLPGLATAIVARTSESTWALAGFSGGTLVFSWLRFSERIGDVGTGLAAILFGIGVAFLAVPMVRRINVVALGGGVLTGTGSSILWEPCVGAEFGTLLGELPTAGPVSVATFGVYLIGVLAPLFVVGGLLAAIPSSLLLPARPLLVVSGVSILVGWALATALGFHDEIVSQLIRWST